MVPLQPLVRARLAAGDIDVALRDRRGERRTRPGRSTSGPVPAWAGGRARHGAARARRRRPRAPSCSSRRPAATSCGSIGGGWRARCLELLTRACSRRAGARTPSAQLRRRRPAPRPSGCRWPPGWRSSRGRRSTWTPASRRARGRAGTRRGCGARGGRRRLRRGAWRGCSRDARSRSRREPERAARRARACRAAFESVRRRALPRRGRARAPQARADDPPPHARREGGRARRRLAHRARARGGAPRSSTARPTPRSRPRCSSARRPSRRTSATCSARSASPHASSSRARSSRPTAPRARWPIVAQLAEHLVGRAEEVGSIAELLDELDRGIARPLSRSSASRASARPGCSPSWRPRADARGQLVLSGSASELEQDLPFWVFVDALEEYAEGLEPRRLDRLADDVRAELALVFPSLFPQPAEAPGALQHERYRSHRAVRELLERAHAEAAARPHPRRPALGRPGVDRADRGAARNGRPPRPCCSRSRCARARCRSGSRTRSAARSGRARSSASSSTR